jgi:hypothetical protein
VGITLTSNLILFRDSKDKVSKRLLRHEEKHQSQMKKYWTVVFYVIYLKDYIKGFIEYGNHWEAYENIPFEIEAREAEIE